MKDLSNVIHLSASADTSNFVYTKVYAGSTTTPTINGVVVSMAAGSSIEILVQSISATADVFVIGTRRIIAPSVING